MIYLLAIVVLALVAIVGFQIYSVIKADQNKIEQMTEDEPAVMDNGINYQSYTTTDEENSPWVSTTTCTATLNAEPEWVSTTTSQEPVAYTFAGKTETDVVEVKEKKSKKKSYYKKKDKKSTGEKTAPKMKAKGDKKKGGKDDLLLS
jgi:hypothetical protein